MIVKELKELLEKLDENKEIRLRSDSGLSWEIASEDIINDKKKSMIYISVK